MSGEVCGCGHALSEHDETGQCQEWWRYPDVLTARQCGCVKPWTRVPSTSEGEGA